MTKAEREAKARRRLSRLRAEQAAYGRGDCVECFKPHCNVHSVTRMPTRVCATCQSRRTARQRERRTLQRIEALAKKWQRIVASGRTVLGQ